MTELHEAKTLAELMTLLKREEGDSNSKIAKKIGISAGTVWNALHGARLDDSSLDAIADYAGVTHEWIYTLAKGSTRRARYSPTVMALAALLEQAPADIQEDMFVMARALIKARKQKRGKSQQEGDDFDGR